MCLHPDIHPESLICLVSGFITACLLKTAGKIETKPPSKPAIKPKKLAKIGTTMNVTQ